MKVLLVSEGSGGHLIPALQVADRLARSGATVQLWYAQREQTAALTEALTRNTQERVELAPIPIAGGGMLARLWQCGQLWSRSQQCFDRFAPDVVVGFGGWISAPVVMAARQRRIDCMVHEQNVELGRANRWLARWVDRVAVSFPETRTRLNGHPAVVTGMPVREAIGLSLPGQGAAQFGLQASRPTVLVLGGSQGSRAVNRLLVACLPQLSVEERRQWQFLHISGLAQAREVQDAYTREQLTAWAGAFVADMDAAYAQADVVIARAGASTIAELARCGKPAILIPYPHAGAHQRANAQVAAASGGAIVLEESATTPEALLGQVRAVMRDTDLRQRMGAGMRRLAVTDAAARLAQVINELGQG